jgi:hypothetical protein
VGCWGKDRKGEVVGLGLHLCLQIHSFRRSSRLVVWQEQWGTAGVEGCSISVGQLWMDVGGLSGASVPVRVATLNAWLMGFNLTPSNAERRVKVSIPAPPHPSTFLCMHLLRFMYLVEKA